MENVKPKTEAQLRQEQAAEYEKKIVVMNDRQLLSEIKKRKKGSGDGVRFRNVMIATVLEAIFENHLKGMTPYVR